jgi:flagellar biosynthesis/type III secretory pathway protein FliH
VEGRSGSGHAARPLTAVDLKPIPLNVGEWLAPDSAFKPDFESSTGQTTPEPRLPRSWTEVEALVESRLAAFEERHRQENDSHFERGMQEGMRQCEFELEQRLEAARLPLEQLAARVGVELAKLREGLYTQAAELAAALAEAWLGRLVAINTTVFTAALHDALEPLAHQDDITVRLNPEDYRTLRDGLETGDESFMAFESLRIVADAGVERGGAIAESAGGTVDACLATRTQRALEALYARDREDVDGGC